MNPPTFGLRRVAAGHYVSAGGDTTYIRLGAVWHATRRRRGAADLRVAACSLSDARRGIEDLLDAEK